MLAKLTREQIEEINKKIDLIELVANYNIEYRKDSVSRYRIACPFHEGDNDPSLTIYTHTSPHSWSCFGCKKGGDAIGFFQKISGKTFYQVIESYCDTRKVLNIEDYIRAILESGKKFSQEKFLLSLVESGRLSIFLKCRSILQKFQTDVSKIAAIQSILMAVDDFVESEIYLGMSEFEVKDFFRKAEKDAKYV